MSGGRERLHVFSAMILCAGYLVSSLASAGAAGAAAILISEGLVARTSEEGPSGLRRWMRDMRVIAPVALTIVAVNSVTGTGSFEVVAIRFPLGTLAITAEALGWGIAMALRLSAAAGAFCLLQALADQDEMLFAISHPSSKSSLAMALTLRLAPYMRRRVRAVSDVVVLRNRGEKAGTMVERVRAQAPVLRAAVYESLELSVDLAEAMYTRGWGAGPRSRYPTPPFRAGDTVVSIASVFGMALMIMAGAAGEGTWPGSPGAFPCAMAAGVLPAAAYAGIQRWSRVSRKR